MTPDVKIGFASAIIFVTMVGGAVAYKSWLAPALQYEDLGNVFTVTPETTGNGAAGASVATRGAAGTSLLPDAAVPTAGEQTSTENENQQGSRKALPFAPGDMTKPVAKTAAKADFNGAAKKVGEKTAIGRPTSPRSETETTRSAAASESIANGLASAQKTAGDVFSRLSKAAERIQSDYTKSKPAANSKAAAVTESAKHAESKSAATSSNLANIAALPPLLSAIDSQKAVAKPAMKEGPSKFRRSAEPPAEPPADPPTTKKNESIISSAPPAVIAKQTKTQVPLTAKDTLAPSASILNVSPSNASASGERQSSVARLSGAVAAPSKSAIVVEDAIPRNAHGDGHTAPQVTLERPTSIRTGQPLPASGPKGSENSNAIAAARSPSAESANDVASPKPGSGRSVYHALPVSAAAEPPRETTAQNVVIGPPQPRIIAKAQPLSREPIASPAPRGSTSTTIARSDVVSSETAPAGASAQRPESFKVVGPSSAGASTSGRFHVVARKEPITQATGPGAVNVVAYDLESYVVLAGDTFASIADSMYGSKDYAAALARFNRAPHGTSTQLAPGSRVRIPPEGILEQEYPSLVGRAGEPLRVAAGKAQKPDEPKVSTQFASAEKPSQASAAAALSAPPKEATQRSENGRNGTANTYTVNQPETLWAISRKTLGDGRRWREIYRLNTDRLESEYSVPLGVTLRLPPPVDGPQSGQVKANPNAAATQ